MTNICVWENVDKEKWSFRQEARNVEFLVFSLTKLPDFSDPRFSYLSEKVDERPAEVIQKQYQTLRQLHSFGDDFGCSLRIIKDGNHLSLFIVCRIASKESITESDLARYRQRIIATFPHEYTIEFVEKEKKELRSNALDSSWINQGAEIYKSEETYRANTIPFFYSSSLWSSTSNDMSMLCRTMLRYTQKCAIEITITPSSFVRDERDWIDTTIRRLRDAQMGERIYADKNKLLKQFDPMPGLKIPADNYENLIKRYDANRLFISSIRVFSEGDPNEIVESLVSCATKTKAQIIHFKAVDPRLDLIRQSYSNIDHNPEIHPDFWDHELETRPFRAQRLHRLVDVEEIANFWRIPIPITNVFPGFELDTGMGNKTQVSTVSKYINLGQYSDDPAKSEVSAEFSKQQLVKHGLIVGVPGSGKTTAVFNILNQLWGEHKSEDRTPFIVLEPAKTEYRALKNVKHFADDLMIFTLGDERVSPFRFNPFEVMPGIPLESHISRLNSCFIGAFDLFDPLPLLLDKAIRQTYYSKGWFDDSLGAEPGVESPTISDLCIEAEKVISVSGYSDKLKDDFNASLLQRLNSLRRGSKGRMLDTKKSISAQVLMNNPIILELDSLNDDEKALMMMFLLTFVYEYCKNYRRSGSPLKHVLVVEEAHNIIGANNEHNEYRANPKEQTINLFIRMLAEMRALGQGILIADQLPTAIAPQAIKQTNIKLLMRITSKDDREEIGNTMDLSESEMKNVVHFKTGQAYIYHEALDRVRMVDMFNYKEKYHLEEPQSDDDLRKMMIFFERENPELFIPFDECNKVCKFCNRRVYSQAVAFVDQFINGSGKNTYNEFVAKENGLKLMSQGKTLLSALNFCSIFYLATMQEGKRIKQKYGSISLEFPPCAYIQMIHSNNNMLLTCRQKNKKCKCTQQGFSYLDAFMKMDIGE